MSPKPTNYFILVYDMTTRHVDVHDDFGHDMDRATERYGQLEDELGPSERYEIVLVGADSIETIKRTHAPYFSTGSVSEIVDAFIASIA